MSEVTFVSWEHKFGDRKGGQISVVSIDCQRQGCEMQCGFTGLTISDAVVSDNNELVGGRTDTRVYVANSLEEFEALDLDDMSSGLLQLDPFSRGVSLAFSNSGEELTGYTIDQVEKRLVEGGCLVKLAGIDLV